MATAAEMGAELIKPTVHKESTVRRHQRVGVCVCVRIVSLARQPRP